MLKFISLDVVEVALSAVLPLLVFSLKLFRIMCLLRLLNFSFKSLIDLFTRKEIVESFLEIKTENLLF